MKQMGAAQFKATCLSVLADVRATGKPVLVTKNGKPYAKVVPVEPLEDPLAIFQFGSLKALVDLDDTSNESDEWEMLQ